MEGRFTKESIDLADQDLIERIYNPDKYLPEEIEAAYEEIKFRELEGIDFSIVKQFFIEKNISEKIQGENFASMKLRLVAFIWDLVIGTVACLLILILLSPLGLVLAYLGTETLTLFASGFLLLFWFVYFSYCESSASRATYGKRIMKLKVVMTDGEKLDFSLGAFRFLMKIVSGLTFGIGFIMAFFNSSNQTLHDTVVGTYVLRIE